MHSLHIVCGLPASGKTTLARQLAADLGAALFDSDSVADLIIQAAHTAAGLDPHDRDSPLYKTTYRDPVYQTLFALAEENLKHTSVVIAGPFTQELKNQKQWQLQLEQRFPNHQVILHPLQIEESLRLERMSLRQALRDLAKLEERNG